MSSDVAPALDAYCYPGSSILRNKYNIRDQAELKKLEFHVVRCASLTLPRAEPTEAGFKESHVFLYGQLYSWAGHQRMTDLMTAGIDHTKPQSIGSELTRQFSWLRAERNFAGLKPNEFAERAAPFFGELAVIAPFRAGNDITLRYFMQHVADHAGHGFSVKGMDKQAWVIAKQQSAQGDYKPMAETLRACIAAAPSIALRIDNAKAKAPPSKSRDDSYTR
jgi:cell filamentation protein